jgi:hypothetical protein
MHSASFYENNNCPYCTFPMILTFFILILLTLGEYNFSKVPTVLLLAIYIFVNMLTVNYAYAEVRGEEKKNYNDKIVKNCGQNHQNSLEHSEEIVSEVIVHLRSVQSS